MVGRAVVTGLAELGRCAPGGDGWKWGKVLAGRRRVEMGQPHFPEQRRKRELVEGTELFGLEGR
jgi:hypothetical protein